MQSACTDTELTPSEKLVALTLGMLVCGKYRATHYPLQHDIALASGLSVRHIKRLIPALEKAGHIRRRPLGVGQGWNRTIYRLMLKPQPMASKNATEVLDKRPAWHV
jgi:hypothetical protein